MVCITLTCVGEREGGGGMGGGGWLKSGSRGESGEGKERGGWKRERADRAR